MDSAGNLASQFGGGGGGFVTNSQGDNAPQSSPGQKKYSNNQTLRAVTIKQLIDGTANTQDDQYKVDGEALDNITLVGKILSVQEQSTNLTLVLDDGTGKVDVKYWIDSDEGDQLAVKKATWREGVFVRVHGHLRHFGGEKSIVAFSIRPITDFNEVTYHGLQVIFQHLYITRGGTGGAAVPKPEAATPPKPGPGGHAGGSYGMANGAGGFNAGGEGAMTPVQDAVNQVLNQPDAQAIQDGISISEIANRLGNRYSVAEVKIAAEWLANEGHAYTGLDENHYRSTAC